MLSWVIDEAVEHRDVIEQAARFGSGRNTPQTLDHLRLADHVVTDSSAPLRRKSKAAG